MIEIRQCTVSEIEGSPNITDLLSEYAKELIVPDAPPFSAKMALYKQLETSGALQVFGAYFKDLLVGLVTILVTIFPHCDVTMSVTESLFVLRDYRKTGAGMKLIHEAEQISKKKGAVGIFISAPYGGNLAEVLPHVGYTETNRVFFRSLSNV